VNSTRSLALLAALASPAAGQTLVHTLSGDAPGDRLGSSVAALGDLNGDGVDELAAGAPGNDTAGADAGLVRIYDGASGATLQTLLGTAAGDFFGFALAALGDVDEDGTADFIVGAPQVEYEPSSLIWFTGPKFGPGYVKVFSGADWSVIHHLSGTVDGQAYGLSVGGGGDVSGDGVPDFIVGAPGEYAVSFTKGYGWVRSGATGFNVWRAEGFGLGYAVALVGDTDGDGLDEFACGHVEYGANAKGTVRLFSSNDGTELWNFSGQPGDEFGLSLAPLGDVDGDGVADLAAGAPEDGALTQWGEGYVRWLSGADGASIRKKQKSADFLGFGFATCSVGDLDYDGLSEVAASSPGLENSPGIAVQIHPASGPIVIGIQPVAGSDRFGYALARAHHGSLAALVVGDPQNGLGDGTGQVTVHTLDLAPFAYCTAKTNSQGCQAAISSTGSPSASHGPFTVDAANVINNKNGLLFYGYTPASNPFSGGTKCVGNPVVRTPVQGSGGNPPPNDCSGAFSYDFATRIQAGVDAGLVVGETVFCQYWYRDPQDPQFTSLSNGLTFQIAP
jgi:hypothetical protein